MAELYGLDAYSPSQIAGRVEKAGVQKAQLPLLSLIALGVLAGGFIGLGAMFSTLAVSDPDIPFALSRILGGLVFSLGLILVVIAGAELFTGNNLMVMAWVDRKISTRLLLRNFTVVYCANFAGASGLSFLVWLSGYWKSASIGAAAIQIAAAKVQLPIHEAFFRGVLCNVLVCLAVWLAMAARDVAGKILAILFPITAFVACGFEHCVANMYLIPLGMLLTHSPETGHIAAEAIGTSGLFRNLLPVTLGNLFGGSVMVGLVYHTIYLRGHRR